MEKKVRAALRSCVNALLSVSTETNKTLLIEYDPQWPSPCYSRAGEPGEVVPWQPVPMDNPLDFSNIENALELSLDKQYCAFFSEFWSFNLSLQATDGNCELLQVSNDQDFANLQQNLIGHLLMKQRLKQPLTLFFALTDEEDFILCVDNETGAVVLEQVGKAPSRTLAPDLASFLASLSC